MIRSYGFVTFEEMLDEGYDDDWDPRRRFDRVYATALIRERCGDSALHLQPELFAAIDQAILRTETKIIPLVPVS